MVQGQRDLKRTSAMCRFFQRPSDLFWPHLGEDHYHMHASEPDRSDNCRPLKFPEIASLLIFSCEDHFVDRDETEGRVFDTLFLFPVEYNVLQPIKFGNNHQVQCGFS